WHSLRHELVAPPELEGRPQKWDRPLLWAEIALPDGRPLTLVDLHLRAPRAVPAEQEESEAAGWAAGFYRAAVRRLGQALEARLLVERLLAADPEALVAVCGDCNATLEDDALHLLEGGADEAGAAVPSGSRLVALARSLPADRRFSLLYGGERLLLDHILASRPLHGLFRGLEIHNELLSAEAEDGAGSGHAPLVAAFALA
ncbi:MAG: endonuclease/exonuclease/phosphatase family protein, partial [Tistlia sp.]